MKKKDGIVKREDQPTVIVLVGPTAVGKTKLSLSLAKYFNTAIISADSRQCYREMTIGTAVPSAQELAAVKHYFIHSHSIKENVNAGVFERLALGYLDDIFKQHPIAIVSGGTGLYIKALCEGIDPIPEVDSKVKEQLQQTYQKRGLQWLQNQLLEKDAVGYSQLETQNPQRLLRALAVLESTGKPLQSYHSTKKAARPFRIIKIGLSLPKEELWDNIRNRTDQMVEKGLVKEAKELFSQRQLNALQTVGYKEIFEYLEQKKTLDRAIEEIKIHTRQYAKRQMTWFKKDKNIHWFTPDSTSDIWSFLNREININLKNQE